MKKKSAKPNGFREAYKRTRKPAAPAERVIPDKRKKILDEALNREASSSLVNGVSRDAGMTRSGRGEAEFARARIFVSGKVQGVFFRASAIDKGNMLGLTGWVRNRFDGRVEILAEGLKETLRMMVDWSYEGPPAAEVEEVEVFWEDATGEFASFGQAHTG
jgi:acylphosphatase